MTCHCHGRRGRGGEAYQRAPLETALTSGPAWKCRPPCNSHEVPTRRRTPAREKGLRFQSGEQLGPSQKQLLCTKGSSLLRLQANCSAFLSAEDETKKGTESGDEEVYHVCFSPLPPPCRESTRATERIAVRQAVRQACSC